MSTFDLEDATGELFDYATTQPEGFTSPEACEKLGISQTQFERALHRLRRILGHDDTINLVCEPAGQRAPFQYKLVGNLADAMWWRVNRQKYNITHLITMQAVNQSIIRSTDGRSLEGRRARLIGKTLSRLVEDLAELNAESAT